MKQCKKPLMFTKLRWKGISGISLFPSAPESPTIAIIVNVGLGLYMSQLRDPVASIFLKYIF